MLPVAGIQLQRASDWTRAFSTFGSFQADLIREEDAQVLQEEARLFTKLAWDPQGFFHRVSRNKWVPPLLDAEDRNFIQNMH
eukprot:1205781-Pyramimonas_sp.AAC.1